MPQTIVRTETSLSEIRDGRLFVAGRALEEWTASLSMSDMIRALWKQEPESLHEESKELRALSEELWVDLVTKSQGQKNPYDLLVGHLLALRERLLSTKQSSSHWTLAYAIFATWTRAQETPEYSGRLLNFILNRKTDEAYAKLFEQVMMVHAENEFNFSTLTLRLGVAAGADFLSSLVAALSVLIGHKHGGASADVMHFLLNLDDDANLPEVVRESLAAKKRIPGFGHLVFREGDPRALILKGLLSDFLAGGRASAYLFDKAFLIEEEMFQQKQLKPNVDFYSGVVYATLGISQKWATSIFAISRFIGWSAHFEEETRLSALSVQRD